MYRLATVSISKSFEEGKNEKPVHKPLNFWEQESAAGPC